jgi:CheY-like chemotaxis protein
VAAAASASEALGLLDAGAAFDALVCDVGLPGLSGPELLAQVAERLRARGGVPPACAVSAHARAEDRARAIEAGFELYLEKPVAPALLLEAVAELVGA